jgi:hypothetical protein
VFSGAISRYPLQSFMFLKKKHKRIFATIGAKKHSFSKEKLGN